MSRTIKFRTECIQKQADLLLMEVLKYYNIPIRTSNERILNMNSEEYLNRELILSYEKKSNIEDKGILYSINIRLIECIGPNFVIFDYENGNSLYKLYVEEFSVIINGEKVKASCKLLKELNEIVLSKIDKPFNLGNPTLICAEGIDWHPTAELAPIYGTKVEKRITLEKVAESFIPHLSDKVIEHIKRNIDAECKTDVEYDSIEVTYKSNPFAYEYPAIINTKFNIGEYNCSTYIYFDFMHSSKAKKVDWLFMDGLNIIIDGNPIFKVDQDDEKKKEVLRSKVEIINSLNTIASKTAKKIYKQGITA